MKLLPIVIETGQPALMCLGEPATKLSNEERTLCSLLNFIQCNLWSHFVDSSDYVFDYNDEHHMWALEQIHTAGWVEASPHSEVPWRKRSGWLHGDKPPTLHQKKELGQAYRLVVRLPYRKEEG